MKGKSKTRLRFFVTIFFLFLIVYGAGRMYFRVTDGFRIANISTDYISDERWEISALEQVEQRLIGKILSQNFRYLDKGCQSYVFASEDGKYVIKFFKYQRFRPQFYFDWFSFIPYVEKVKQRKIAKKRIKLEGFYDSWKFASDHLKPETGLIYVQLNKRYRWDKPLTIYDKMGFKHELNLNEMEFLVQKKATMLCSTLDHLMVNQQEEEAKQLLTRLVLMIVSEYNRGLADNDHALMQNTGVFEGDPIHVDVGQFVSDDRMRESQYYYQELFNKTYKFRLWLENEHPKLLSHLNQELLHEIGDAFYTLKHIPKDRTKPFWFTGFFVGEDANL